jgi:nicotinamide mononucleotide transporter
VWLVVRQNVWTYPLGIANNILFLILFSQSRLFGDAGLQVVYMGLAAHGWYLWLRGGVTHTGVKISRSSTRLLATMTLFVATATYALMILLHAVQGAAPLLDAFTTALSLAAQYLQNNKKIEHWYFWITADVFYIYLYTVRGLHLTAVLYGIFLCMCVAGVIEWRKSLAKA